MEWTQQLVSAETTRALLCNPHILSVKKDLFFIKLFVINHSYLRLPLVLDDVWFHPEPSQKVQS